MPPRHARRRGQRRESAHRERRRLRARLLQRSAGQAAGDRRGTADRRGRADAIPARSLAGASPAPRRRARSHRHVPRSDHRRDRAGERLLDAERPASSRSDASSWRKGDHRAGGAEARDRLADPRAQHREGAQPARQVARGHPHLPQPDRRGSAEDRERRLLLPEEASFATMGLCYEKSPRFSGAVYNSFVRRLTEFSGEPLAKALRAHEKRSEKLLELDERVNEVVKKLKAKGFVSPYLKSFVIARSNPLRFMKEAPELDDLINTIRGKIERFNVDKVRQQDIVASGGAPDED